MSAAITFTLRHYFEPTQRHCGQVEIRNKSELQNVPMTETKQTMPYKLFCLNRNSERIPRRFCLTAVLRGLRG
jgi:hypothetical protein